MAPHLRSSPSPRGITRGNMFLEHDPDEQHNGMSVVASPAGAPGRRRGRVRVVPVDEAAPCDPAAVTAVERFTRPRGSVSCLTQRAREYAQRADRNAQRLLAGVAGRHHGPLLSLVGVAALLLAISGLSLSLRDAASARDHTERQLLATTVALGQAHGRIHTLADQRDQAIGAARSARRSQAALAAKLAASRARVRSARVRHARGQPRQ